MDQPKQRGALSAQDAATLERTRADAHYAQETLLQVAGTGRLDAESVIRVRQDFERYDEIARELEGRYPDNAEIKTLRHQLDAWKQGR
jgi:hypothetical protein